VTREVYIERSCRELAKARGCILLKLWPAGAAGIPDRILLMPRGRVVFIEFKAPGKKPGPLQRHWHEVLRGLGFQVEVMDNAQAFRAIIQTQSTT